MHRIIVALLAITLLLPACERRADEEPPVQAALELGELLGGADTLHERAVAVRAFDFPADHGPHPGFRTEWWYYTGNLTAEDGREFGYQLTFFRSALTDHKVVGTLHVVDDGGVQFITTNADGF